MSKKDLSIAFLTSSTMYLVSRLNAYQIANKNFLLIGLLVFFMTFTFGHLLPNLFKNTEKKGEKSKNSLHRMDNLSKKGRVLEENDAKKR